MERFILRGSAGLNVRDTTTSPPSFMVSVDAKPMPLVLRGGTGEMSASQRPRGGGEGTKK